MSVLLKEIRKFNKDI